MSEQKPTFGIDNPEMPEKAKPKREELAVVWKKLDKNGNEYVSVKVKLDAGKELNFKAFHNKRKQDGDTKPSFIAYKDQN